MRPPHVEDHRSNPRGTSTVSEDVDPEEDAVELVLVLLTIVVVGAASTGSIVRRHTAAPEDRTTS